MPNSEFKQIHIKLPTAVYEAFYHRFPGRGERTKFLQAKICEEIDKSPLPEWKEKQNETKKS